MLKCICKNFFIVMLMINPSYSFNNFNLFNRRSLLNNVFTPSIEVIERAKKITSTFEEANTGLVVIDGKLIEKPVLREMYRILSIANKLNN